MIYLGNVRQAGAAYITRRAVATVKDQGRAAIFIGENGEAAAYSYLHAEYDRHLSRHHESLVGVYQNAPACDRVCCELVRAIEADVDLHLVALGLVEQLEQAA
jgi:hypothetical protein